MLKHFVFHNTLHNTFPIVIHYPGIELPKGDLWQSLLSYKPPRKPKEYDAEVLVWNNREKGPAERSLDRLGVSYRVLGQHIQRWRNQMKLALTVGALATTTSKYVIGLDSCDVIVLDDPSVIIERFQTMKCKMLFNCQCCCYPPFIRSEDDINDQYDNRYLNSGAWIGETEFCREFFAKCQHFPPGEEKHWKISDQVYVRSVFPSYQKDIKLDYRCEVFQVIEDDQSMLRLVR